MLTTIVAALLPLLPTFIQAVETLFQHKPKSGLEKAGAVQQLALNALVLAHIIDPKQIGDAEAALVRAESDAIVAYLNAKGVFAHTA